MGKEIVKIDRKDIKEAVVSCINRLVNESQVDGVLKYDDMYYCGAKYVDGLRMYYFTDNLDYAKKYFNKLDASKRTSFISAFDLVFPAMRPYGSEHIELIDLGEFVDEDKIKEYNQKYNNSVVYQFYPDNITTCILFWSSIGVNLLPSNIIRTEVNPYTDEEIKPQKIQLKWAPPYPTSYPRMLTKNDRSVGYFVIVNRAQIIYKDKNIGAVSVNEVASKDLPDCVRYLTNTGKNINLIQRLTKDNKTYHVIDLAIQDMYENNGIGTEVVRRIIREFGNNEHYLFCGNINNSFINGQDTVANWDIVEKVAVKFGFKLIYYDDEIYVYCR